MDCADVTESRIRGEPLSAALAEHAAGCPFCSAASGDQAPILDASLLASVEGALAEERGPVAWLRSRPTEVRLLLSAGVVTFVAAFVLLVSPRSQYAPVPIERVVLVVSVLAVVLLAVVRLALRPLQAREPRPGLLWAAAVGALLVPVAFAVLPQGEAFAMPGVSPVTAGLVCFTGGILSGVLVVVALWLLDRESHAALSRALLASAAGGLAGNLALELHCPNTAASHLLTSHASVGFVLVALYALARRGR